jgi:VWFA-related protein
MRAGGAGLLLAAAALAAALEPAPAGTPPPQVFTGRTERVTVDVVVLDKRGDPVTGLTREAFSLLEEGGAREIDTFDVVRTPETASPGPAPRLAARPRVATNSEGAPERGRQFVIVFDDLHMSPLNAQRAKAAVAGFLEKGTREGDRALLVATGGGAWWSTRLADGRGDLLAVLKHLDGRRLPDNALERLTDHEAAQIFLYRNTLVAARVMERFERYSTRSRQGMEQSQQQQAMNAGVPGLIDPYLEHRAQEAYLKLKARLEVTLAVLERSFRAVADSRDRKAVLLVSEGFVHDPSLDALKRATEAARRANAALYFIDTRGLEALPQAYSAEFGAPLQERDLMAAIADTSFEGEGAAALARDTGGFAVRNTNDFAAGAVRIGRESRSYYLLGYDPGEIPHDGRFRKIEVRVRGRGLTVRARKGYYAPSAPGQAPVVAARDRGRELDLQRALDAPGAVMGVPLRMTAYALQDAGSDKAQVLLAAEADVSQLGFPEGGGPAVLDTLMVVTHRESGEHHRRDQRVELQRRSDAPAGRPLWYAFARDFELPAGGFQAKLVVRDPARQQVGALTLEFEIPPLDGLRVSTPILTDALQRSADGTVSPALSVRRAFASGGQLYCRFDVFRAAKGPDGLPRVKAGHALRRADGALVGLTPPHTIQPTSIGALARLIQIPLKGTPAGEYELVLTVSDEVSGKSVEVVEPFSVTAGTGSAAAR